MTDEFIFNVINPLLSVIYKNVFTVLSFLREAESLVLLDLYLETTIHIINI